MEESILAPTGTETRTSLSSQKKIGGFFFFFEFIVPEQLLRQINCLHISKILFKFAAREKAYE